MYTIHAMYSDPRFRTSGPVLVWTGFENIGDALGNALTYATEKPGEARVKRYAFDSYRITTAFGDVYWVQPEDGPTFP